MTRTRTRTPARWTLAGVRLPEEDADNVRGIAISAAWAHEIILNPPKPAPRNKDERRCPVLPRCFPIIQPAGLVVARDETTFHGIERRESLSCPFR